MDLSSHAVQLTPSLTLAIDSKAKAMRAEGIDVCGFGAGEPDFDTPEHIKEAAIKALQEGFTKYTPSAGLPELRTAISEKFAADNQVDYKPNQIVVSNGAKQSCYNAILACCEPGDCKGGRLRIGAVVLAGLLLGLVIRESGHGLHHGRDGVFASLCRGVFGLVGVVGHDGGGGGIFGGALQSEISDRGRRHQRDHGDRTNRQRA